MTDDSISHRTSLDDYLANAVIDDEIKRRIDRDILARYEAIESALIVWMEGGERGRIWQGGPLGEIWIDTSADVVGERIIYEHPRGQRDRFRGVTPGPSVWDQIEERIRTLGPPVMTWEEAACRILSKP